MTNVVNNLALPFTGIFISFVGYLLGMLLFNKSHGFFLFNPLLVAMVFGISVLAVWAVIVHSDTATIYLKFYKPGGDIIFWFLNPATMSFAIPLYRRNDVFKKYWFDIIVTIFVGCFIAIFAIDQVTKLFGLSHASAAAMLPQAATTAVAMPIASEIGGVPAVTAMACIINAVFIYALGDILIKVLHLNKLPKVSNGLGLSTAGHAIGSVKALQLGEVEGASAAIAVVLVAIAMDIPVPIYAHLFM